MKITLFLLVIAFCFFCFSESAPRRRKIKNWFSKSELKKASRRSKKTLLGPHMDSPSLSGLPRVRPQSLVQGHPFGIRSKVKFITQNRPQVRDANFGPNPVAPRRVRKRDVISPPKRRKPKARRSNLRPEPLEQLTEKQKRQIAQVIIFIKKSISRDL